MRLLIWVLASKTRVTMAVAAVAIFELSVLFANGRRGLERFETSVPLAAVVAGPFLIALAVLVQVWARKDTRRKLIGNIAYGMTLIWSMSYAFVLFVAIRRFS